MLGSRRRTQTTINVWPGYVDALSALLLLVIFMLLIFTLAQVFLAETVSDRDAELNRLNDRLAEISSALRLQEQNNETLNRRLLSLRDQYNQSVERQKGLEEQVSALEETVNIDRNTIEVQLREKASLQQDIVALQQMRTELELEISNLVTSLNQSEQMTEQLETALLARDELVGSLRDRTMVLEANLATEQERTLLAQREIVQKDIRIEDLVAITNATETALNEEKLLSARAQADIDRLSQQIDALQEQLDQISTALALEKDLTNEQKVQLADLGDRLNTALAQRVNELEQYRSDFFGRLRIALANNSNVRIEGDRFLLPSELLFGSASATLGIEGQQELNKLAQILKEVANDIPEDINWILRIDGHTDQLPINTERFPSNWELSTARAVSVVRYLATQGIAQERMAAAGFGEHHPVDLGFTEEAFRNNRRIEIKLTNR
jgi:chemotaxis protein MotB